MSLPSQILNVLPGGKYHEQAQAVQIFPDAELQYRRTDNVESSWINALSEDCDVFSDTSFEDGYPLEWRIKPKPKTQSYRVAEFESSIVGRAITDTADDVISANEMESVDSFVCWLTDWIEYEAS